MRNNCCLFKRLCKTQKNGVFPFGISFIVLEISNVFLLYEFGDWWCHGDGKILKKIALELLKYCSSNLPPDMFITKKTNDTQCHCHGNSLSPSHFLSKTKYPHFQPFKSATEGPWGDIHVKEWCQLSRRILLVIMICISYFQGLEISFPKITQVVKFQQKSPAHQLPVSAQGLHLNHKGLRELKKLWRTSGCPLLAAALGINRFVLPFYRNYLFCLL